MIIVLRNSIERNDYRGDLLKVPFEVSRVCPKLYLDLVDNNRALIHRITLHFRHMRIVRILQYQFNLKRLSLLTVIHRIRWFVFSHSRKTGNVRNTVYDLTISLTTTIARLPFLEKTIQTLLMQSYRPSSIHIYIESEFLNTLRVRISQFEKWNVRTFPGISGIRAANKLIPELLSGNPSPLIIYLDDDVIYPRNLVRSMLKTFEKFGGNVVVANWVQMCQFTKSGEIQSYEKWTDIRKCSFKIYGAIPLGVGGVMIPRNLAPESLYELQELIKCTASNDDLWYFTHLSLAKVPIVLNVRKQRIPILWRGSQENALWKENVNQGGNDRNMKLLLEHYPSLKSCISNT